MSNVQDFILMDDPVYKLAEENSHFLPHACFVLPGLKLRRLMLYIRIDILNLYFPSVSAKAALQFQFAKYYASHMVLQRAPHQAVVWGYGPLTPENRTITLILEGGTQVQEHFVPVVKQSKW